jgi:23S rRNA (guanosine2251-2'-O)-methyltransferase
VNYKNDNRNKKGRASDRPRDNGREFDTELSENVIFGRNSVRELLESGRDIEKIYVSEGEREGSILSLIAEARERRLNIVEADRRKLDRIALGGRHQGIIAVAAERDYSTLDDILAFAAERGEKPLVVVLDGIEDPHNLGAIIRSAECLGAHGVIIPKRRSVGLTATVSKASAGALEHMRVARVTNLAVAVDELKERGLWIYAADMGEGAYYENDLTGSAAIVMGSEGFGISRLVREKCDFTLSIPLFGSVNSMNVSCAAAVLLAECAKQRTTKRR